MKNNSLFSKIIIVLLCFGILLGLWMPAMAAGAEENFSSPVILNESAKDYTVTGKWTGSLNATKEKQDAVITVKKGYTGILTLDSAVISNLGDYVAAIKVESGARPTIMVKNANSISSGNFRAGIEVGEGAKVNIVGNGTLYTLGGAYGAGIGGGNGMTAGQVNIADYYDATKNHTRITAVGGASAAGIGGGFNGSGGMVVIEGGFIKAQGKGSSQDIGRGTPAEGIKLVAGTTQAKGGKLVNYKKIDWAFDDVEERKETKLKIEAFGDESTQQNITLMMEKPYEQAVMVSDIPNSQGLKEIEVAYVYLPKRTRVITLSVQAKGYDRMEKYMYGVKDGEAVVVSLRVEDDRKSK